MGTPVEMQFFFATHEAVQMCAIATKREPFLLGFSSFAVDALLSFWDSDILRCWRYEKRRFTVCAVVNLHFLCEIACKELRFLGLLSQFSLMPLGFHRLLVMLGGGILGILTFNSSVSKSCGKFEYVFCFHKARLFRETKGFKKLY